MRVKYLISFLILVLISCFACSGVSNEVVLSETELILFNLLNDIRIQNNLNLLILSQELMDMAELRCIDMVERNYLSHYTPEGKRIRCGEILGRANPSFLGTPENFLNAWLNSPIHKEVILDARYKKIGIGIIDNEDSKIIVILFSSR